MSNLYYGIMIWHVDDYFSTLFNVNFANDDEEDAFSERLHGGKIVRVDEVDAVRRILSAQVAIFVMRRTGGADDENIDGLRDILRHALAEYELEFGKEFVDLNIDVDY